MSVRQKFAGAVGPLLLTVMAAFTAPQTYGGVHPIESDFRRRAQRPSFATNNVPADTLPQQRFQQIAEKIQTEQRSLAARLGGEKQLPNIDPKNPDAQLVRRYLDSINKMAEGKSPEALALKEKADAGIAEAVKAGILPRELFKDAVTAFEAKKAAREAEQKDARPSSPSP